MRISKFLYPPSIARCQHVKVNGVQCGSPALKNRKLCHFHQRWQQGRIQLNANQARRSRYSLDLPILEDANSIQVTAAEPSGRSCTSIRPSEALSSTRTGGPKVRPASF